MVKAPENKKHLEKTKTCDQCNGKKKKKTAQLHMSKILGFKQRLVSITIEFVTIDASI